MEELEWERKMLLGLPNAYTDKEFIELLDNNNTTEVINHSLRIVITTVSNNYGYYYDLDELYGIGVDALLEAIDDYDVVAGSFIEYVRKTIKVSIDSYLMGEYKKISLDEIAEKEEVKEYKIGGIND
jgi:DNA-directed RNA polymerase specialized sigma subunit